MNVTAFQLGAASSVTTQLASAPADARAVVTRLSAALASYLKQDEAADEHNVPGDEDAALARFQERAMAELALRELKACVQTPASFDAQLRIALRVLEDASVDHLLYIAPQRPRMLRGTACAVSTANTNARAPGVRAV